MLLSRHLPYYAALKSSSSDYDNLSGSFSNHSAGRESESNIPQLNFLHCAFSRIQCHQQAVAWQCYFAMAKVVALVAWMHWNCLLLPRRHYHLQLVEEPWDLTFLFSCCFLLAPFYSKKSAHIKRQPPKRLQKEYDSFTTKSVFSQLCDRRHQQHMFVLLYYDSTSFAAKLINVFPQIWSVLKLLCKPILQEWLLFRSMFVLFQRIIVS